MQNFCGKLQISVFKRLKQGNWPSPVEALTFMDKTENKAVNGSDFWKGLMMGTMAGMLIAAYTYGIADRSEKVIDQTATKKAA